MNAKITFTTFLVAFLPFVNVCNASTTRTGPIVNEHWTAEMSPVEIVGDLLVARLTIDPGVDVVFQGNFQMDVAGRLSAVGSSLRPIHFRDTGSGWKGIKFLENGNTSSLVFCVISGSVDSGLTIRDSYPEIRECKFLQNSSPERGAGINILLSSGGLTIVKCEFGGNSAGIAGGGVYADISDGVIEFIQCRIQGNVAGSAETQRNTTGGGVRVNGRSIFRNTDILENEVRAYTIYVREGRGTYGGGAYLYGDSELYNCRFLENACITSAHGQTPDRSFAIGGAIRHRLGKSIAQNCLFANNRLVADRRRTLSGSAIAVEEGEFSALNCTVVNNVGATAIQSVTPFVLTNCIVYSNNNEGRQMEGQVDATYSDVQNGWPGLGNFTLNPIIGEDFRVLPGSPAIDAANPGEEFQDQCFPHSLGSSRGDLGHFGGPKACDWENATLGGVPPSEIDIAIKRAVVWPAETDGFVLYVSDSPEGPWSAYEGPITLLGGENIAVVDGDEPSNFFRLVKE